MWSHELEVTAGSQHPNALREQNRAEVRIDVLENVVQKARSVSEIIVSTDDDEIASVAASEGVNVSRRPDRLGGDDVRAVDVVNDVVQKLRPERMPEEIAMLLPPSPLRPPLTWTTPCS